MRPHELKSLYRKIPVYIKNTFLTTFLIGIAVHFYVFTNKLPNGDDIADFSGIGGGAVFQGRWLLGVLANIRMDLIGDYSMPWVKGILSIFLLACAACALTEAYHLKSSLAGALLGGILVAFPTIAMNFTFMFLADYFAFAIFLAAFSFYVTVTYKYGYLAGMVALACSIGIYQAYLPFAVMLFLAGLIKDCAETKKTGMQVFREGILYFLTLLGAVLIYFGVNRLFMWHFGMQKIEMHGEVMGNFSWKEIPAVLGRISGAIKMTLTGDYMGVSNTLVIRVLIAVLLFVSVLEIIRREIRLLYRKEWLKALTLIISLFLFPIAMNLIYFMLPETAQGVYLMTLYGLTGIFILPVVLYGALREDDLYPVSDSEKRSRVLERKAAVLMEWIIVSVSILGIGHYAYQTNEIYLYGELAHSSAMSYCTTLITQIKSQEGYQETTPVLITGTEKDTTIYPLTEQFGKYLSQISNIGDTPNREILSGGDLTQYLKLYCGFQPDICEDTDAKQIQKSAGFQKMPCYPDSNSIQMVNGVLVVKLSE